MNFPHILARTSRLSYLDLKKTIEFFERCTHYCAEKSSMKGVRVDGNVKFVSRARWNSRV